MDELPRNDAPNRLIVGCRFGEDVHVAPFTNLYGCEIGAGSRVGPFTEIQSEVRIGANCKIQSHSFICSGVSIGDGAFIGHGVIFVNDKRPRATNEAGALGGPEDWEMLETEVGSGATLGSGAIILGGIRIGHKAMIGAGALVAGDVPAGAVVRGQPARLARPGR